MRGVYKKVLHGDFQGQEIDKRAVHRDKGIDIVKIPEGGVQAAHISGGGGFPEHDDNIRALALKDRVQKEMEGAVKFKKKRLYRCKAGDVQNNKGHNQRGADELYNPGG